MKPGGRRIRRWVFNAITLLSLMLAIAVAWVWVRGAELSLMSPSAIPGTWDQAGIWVVSYDGFVYAGWCHPLPLTNGRWGYDESGGRADPWFPARFDARLFRRELTTQIVLPACILVLIFSVLPTWWLVQRLKRCWGRAGELGHCSNCGYDLRASKGTCPECGEPITAADLGPARWNAAETQPSAQQAVPHESR